MRCRPRMPKALPRSLTPSSSPSTPRSPKRGRGLFETPEFRGSVRPSHPRPLYPAGTHIPDQWRGSPRDPSRFWSSVTVGTAGTALGMPAAITVAGVEAAVSAATAAAAEAAVAAAVTTMHIRRAPASRPSASLGGGGVSPSSSPHHRESARGGGKQPHVATALCQALRARPLRSLLSAADDCRRACV